MPQAGMASTNSNIIATAKSLIGKVDYVFGGDDIAGGKGDCSDFTQYVFKENGIEIGGTTEEQYKKGESVSKDDLEIGDLVFFKNTYNSGYTDGVSHVGIYEGNGKFIHLSSSKNGVTESDLDSDYWEKHYLGARRINYMGSGESLGEVVTGFSKKVFSQVVQVILIGLLFIIGIIFLVLSVDNSI